MLLAISYFLLGLLFLVLAADRFVAGSAALARRLGLSTLLIGLTIVALGTSLPEIVVAIVAAWQGEPGLAIGNAIGSNIANVGLVLGFAALMVPLRVEKMVLQRDYPILLVVTLLAILFLSNGYFGRLDAIILFICLGAFLIFIVWHGLRYQRKHAEITIEPTVTTMSLKWSIIWIISGIIVIPLASELLISGAVGIARFLGVSDFVIGLTVVAVGTSLPELVTSIVSVYKNEHNISVGNIIGSNIFNLLAVLPFPGLIRPSQLNKSGLYQDLAILLVATLAIFLASYRRCGAYRIVRLAGLILLLGYGGYLTWLFAQ